jgi:hypothetical protein
LPGPESANQPCALGQRRREKWRKRTLKFSESARFNAGVFFYFNCCAPHQSGSNHSLNNFCLRLRVRGAFLIASFSVARPHAQRNNEKCQCGGGRMIHVFRMHSTGLSLLPPREYLAHADFQRKLLLGLRAVRLYIHLTARKNPGHASLSAVYKFKGWIWSCAYAGILC